MKKVNPEGEMYNEVGIQYKGLESPCGAGRQVASLNRVATGSFSDKVPFEQDLHEEKKPGLKRPREEMFQEEETVRHRCLTAGVSGSVQGTKRRLYPRSLSCFLQWQHYR